MRYDTQYNTHNTIQYNIVRYYICIRDMVGATMEVVGYGCLINTVTKVVSI